MARPFFWELAKERTIYGVHMICHYMCHVFAGGVIRIVIICNIQVATGACLNALNGYKNKTWSATGGEGYSTICVMCLLCWL